MSFFVLEMYASEAHISAMSAVAQERKTQRLVARISRGDKALLRRAASIEGRTLATFVMAHAVAEAKRLVNEQEVIRLNAEESRLFVQSLLAAPRSPNQALKRAIARYRARAIEA